MAVRGAPAWSATMARGTERPRCESETSRHVHAGSKDLVSDKHPAGSEEHARAVGRERAEHLVTAWGTHFRECTPQTIRFNTAAANVVHKRQPCPRSSILARCGARLTTPPAMDSM